MAQNIRDEITRLHRRKQLNFTYHNMERMQDSESSGSEMGPDSPRRPDTPPHLRNPEKGLFTFKQVSKYYSKVARSILGQRAITSKPLTKQAGQTHIAQLL